jgi:GNAT superfamily N-acetyltransferase
MRVVDWDIIIIDILQAIKDFSIETDLPVTYNPEGAQGYLWTLVNDPDTAIFVCYEEDDLLGFAIASRDSEFQYEYFGFLTKLYVLPKGRGTTAGRELLQEVVDWFDESQCVASFAVPTAGIGQDMAYINLLKKYNFSPTGS